MHFLFFLIKKKKGQPTAPNQPNKNPPPNPLFQILLDCVLSVYALGKALLFISNQGWQARAQFC